MNAEQALLPTHPIRPTNATTFVSSVANDTSVSSTSLPTITASSAENSSTAQSDVFLGWLYKTPTGLTICGLIGVIVALACYIYFGERDGIKETIKDISQKVDVIDKKVSTMQTDTRNLFRTGG